jgi:hypothetical protein
VIFSLLSSTSIQKDTNKQNKKSTLSPTTPIQSTCCMLLHHSETQYYVLNRYCCPVTQNITLHQSLSNCKHPSRECIVYKTKLYSSGTIANKLSPTVVIPELCYRKKHNYDLMEARLVKCTQLTCVNKTKTSSKHFHFSCYMHSIKAKKRQMYDYTFFGTF